MVTLIHHIRKAILFVSFTLAILIYFYVITNFTSAELQKIRLAQLFALIATFYLYLALIASPLYSLFPNLPTKPIHIRARRALGVSAFFFATLHASVAFFGLLGGLAGLPLLSNSYLRAIILSFTAYLILATMASTSFDWAVKRLGQSWKKLHRLVYLAATLIIIHALMLGTHFTDLSEPLPKVYFVALTFLLILEAIRLDRYLAKRFSLNFSFGISLIVVIALLTYASFFLVPPKEGSSSSIGIHANHIKSAEQTQAQQNSSLPNLPGLTGDRSKRYTLDVSFPENIKPNQNVELKFKVFDASNGTLVTVFQKPYTESFHLIIVDSQLEHYNHIHPKQVGSEFVINTSFPKEATYHLYSDFQPLGAIDQQIATTLTVGAPAKEVASLQLDQNLTKINGDYQVTMDFSKPLSSASMSTGKQTIRFNLKSSDTNQAITNLKPYLGAFGHLVMINSSTFDYLHVHPNVLKQPTANANGGPEIEFLPIGIYGIFKPGVYKAFLQFSHNNQINLVSFVVNVEN